MENKVKEIMLENIDYLEQVGADFSQHTQGVKLPLGNFGTVTFKFNEVADTTNTTTDCTCGAGECCNLCAGSNASCGYECGCEDGVCCSPCETAQDCYAAIGCCGIGQSCQNCVFAKLGGTNGPMQLNSGEINLPDNTILGNILKDLEHLHGISIDVMRNLDQSLSTLGIPVSGGVPLQSLPNANSSKVEQILAFMSKINTRLTYCREMAEDLNKKL